ncbi:hypothetical protein TI39_contig328g00007 [Zymoseptoria brevis]|uniref:Uncharacterized protein n=1 Tax=Zymoseptoria brevis TaxID=1047168 RepID=A0A0F4GTX6_9PEZI|nr:hypothetical protein TI39_contig328g00007 [Zymoseptoria brevis]
MQSDFGDALDHAASSASSPREIADAERHDSINTIKGPTHSQDECSLATQFLKVIFPDANEAEIALVLQNGDVGGVFSFTKIAAMVHDLKLADWFREFESHSGKSLVPPLDVQQQLNPVVRPLAPDGACFGNSFDQSSSALLSPGSFLAQEDEGWQSESTDSPPLMPQDLGCTVPAIEPQGQTSDVGRALPRVPCIFPPQPRDPFEEPLPMARLVQEVYIGHSSSPLFVPMQFSKLPFEHGRVYPFGHDPRQHASPGVYSDSVWSDTTDDSLSCPALSSGVCAGFDEENEQHLSREVFDHDDTSSSIEAARDLLLLRIETLTPPLDWPPPPSMVALRSSGKPPRLARVRTALPLLPLHRALHNRSARLPTNQFHATAGTLPLPQSVVVPTLTTNGMGREIGRVPAFEVDEVRCMLLSFRPRWSRGSGSKEFCRAVDIGRIQPPNVSACLTMENDQHASATCLPKLVDFEFSDLQKHMSTQDHSTNSTSETCVDVTKPRTMPSSGLSFSVAKGDDISDITFNGLVVILWALGGLASDLLDDVDVDDSVEVDDFEAAIKFREVQRAASCLVRMTQSLQKEMDAQAFFFTDEGEDKLATLMQRLFTTAETARTIAGMTYSRRHDFLSTLNEIERESMELADDIHHRPSVLRTARERRQDSDCEPTADFGQPTSPSESETEAADLVGRVVEGMPSTSADDGPKQDNGVVRVQAKEPGTLNERLISLRERIRGLHQTLDVGLGVGR